MGNISILTILLEYRVSSLKKDNSRLIDEKCYEKSKNTFLET